MLQSERCHPPTCWQLEKIQAVSGLQLPRQLVYSIRTQNVGKPTLTKKVWVVEGSRALMSLAIMSGLEPTKVFHGLTNLMKHGRTSRQPRAGW